MTVFHNAFVHGVHRKKYDLHCVPAKTVILSRSSVDTSLNRICVATCTHPKWVSLGFVTVPPQDKHPTMICECLPVLGDTASPVGYVCNRGTRLSTCVQSCIIPERVTPR